jgi:hypothetical protein
MDVFLALAWTPNHKVAHKGENMIFVQKLIFIVVMILIGIFVGHALIAITLAGLALPIEFFLGGITVFMIMKY